ncbi:MAG: AraC family transcriptional regulator [Pseudoclavibacter sp.]
MSRTELLLKTDDYGQARAHVTDIYIPHALRAHESHPLDFRIRYVESDRFTVGHLRYGADSELLVPPMESCYHVNLTLHGSTTVAQGAQSSTTEGGHGGVIFTPDHPFTVRWSADAIQYAIKVPRRSLERQVEAFTGRPVDRSVRFDLGFSLDSPAASSMMNAVSHLREELSKPGGTATYPLIRSQLEDVVITNMLTVMSHEYSDDIAATPPAIRRAQVVAAVDFIEERLSEPITVADVARASFMSVRALQKGFGEELGMSPMQYIRARRLERVHDDLLAAPLGARVQDIAYRWGYSHMGRFAEQFRQRFGRLPSSLLPR